MNNGKYTVSFHGSQKEIQEAIEEYLGLCDTPETKPDKFVEWYVYSTQDQLNREFEDFLVKGYPHSYTRREVYVNKDLMVKFTRLSNLAGVVFGDKDTIYLKSRFNQNDAVYLMSRMWS